MHSIVKLFDSLDLNEMQPGILFPFMRKVVLPAIVVLKIIVLACR
jgi:hypothetical protein